MYPSDTTVALRLAVLLKRSGKTRGRVSDKTMRLLAGRPKQLRVPLIARIRDRLDDLGISLMGLDRGGFALVASAALEGAPPMTAKSIMPDRNELTDEDMWKELGMENDADDGE